MVLDKVEALKIQGRESKLEVKILKFEIEKEIQVKKKKTENRFLGQILPTQPTSPPCSHHADRRAELASVLAQSARGWENATGLWGPLLSPCARAPDPRA
jgi:hypothetical protein